MQPRLSEVTATVEQAAASLRQDYAAEHLYALRVGMRRIRSMLKPLGSTGPRRFRKTWGGFAAVLGLRFRLNVLEAAAPERESMVDSIEEADAAQLIRQSIGGRNLRYEFVHALARQTLLSSTEL